MLRSELRFREHATDANKITMTVIPPLNMYPTKELDVTRDDYVRILHWKQNRTNIEQALPHWNADQRELLLSGMNTEEWNKLFPPDKDEDNDGAEEPAF